MRKLPGENINIALALCGFVLESYVRWILSQGLREKQIKFSQEDVASTQNKKILTENK